MAWATHLPVYIAFTIRTVPFDFMSLLVYKTSILMEFEENFLFALTDKNVYDDGISSDKYVVLAGIQYKS